MRYLRLHTLGFAVLLVALTVIHCTPTEAQADRRRRWTTYGIDRGRLVVACDMRSDTCSDGRQITTVRATPAPCETSPGVWEMVPENTGCYSVRGLESWAANTSYVSFGAELDREPWGPTQSSVDIQPLGGGAVRVCNTTEINSGIRQYLGNLTEPGIATGAIIARVYPPITGALIGVFQGVWGVIEHPGPVGSWAQMSFTGEGEEGRREQLIVYPRPSSADRIDCIDIMAAWRTKTATPGRPCWGGEAPVTCAADLHTISTEGWPTTEGEISFAYVNMERTWSRERIFIADGHRFQIKTVVGGRIRVILNEVGTNLPGNPAWRPLDQVQHIRAVLSAGSLEVFVNGVSVGSVETGPIEYSDTARIGTSGTTWANGSIRSLRIRSYKEVSP